MKDFLTNTNDLTINNNGDFQITESNDQNIEDILYSVPGYWKESPLVGVNLYYFLNSSGKQQEMKNIINTQLTSDGFTIKYLIVNQDGTINLDATK